ncbi:MAG: HD-GYP domain-containing protein [Synergistaceae bacterium]|nr:HD-GYP domain-containing protein [Synergistota bacterium]NLM71541.1 HD-GYP domain-containing protein [Synergistaceae bacterium]
MPVSEIQPPWVIDEDILSPSGVPLVVSGAPITPSLKNAMIRNGIMTIRVRTPDEKSYDHKSPIPVGLKATVKQGVQKIMHQTSRGRRISPKLLAEVEGQISILIEALFAGEGHVFSELRSLSNHSEYTYEHSWSVTLFSVVLSRAAWESGVLKRFDYTARLNLGMGAVLHDIGKTFVPPDILDKPGPLDEAEWDVMRLHPKKGFDLLRSYNYLMPMVRAIVAFHHERLDGSGYGLVKGKHLDGENIPMLVRLVSIADAFDAMTSSRPYKRGMLPFEALEVVLDGAGSQFDPDIAPLMGRVVVPFPAGSLLLMKDGSVASVQTPGGLNERSQRPECITVASLSKEVRRPLGDVFTLKDRLDVLLGATCPEGLVERLFKEGDSRMFTRGGDKRISLQAALPLWDELFSKALEKALT